KDMARRVEGNPDAADCLGFTKGSFFRRSGEILAIADRHDVERLTRGEHSAMTGSGMVGVAVGDQRAFNRANGIDVEIPFGTPEPFRAQTQERARIYHAHNIVQKCLSGRWPLSDVGGEGD